MLIELHVEDLGVIERLDVVLGPGLTAITGETGAGKTMLIGAVELVLGTRADASVVRHGGREARVDARFEVRVDPTADPASASGAPVDPGDEAPVGPLAGEVVLTRVVPVDGRSRAYVDGRPVSVGALADRAGPVVDLHGQHAHQSLLRAADQRAALDRFARTDVAGLRAARSRAADARRSLDAAGGDERARARELDLVRFQVAELDAAGLDDPDEEQRLGAEEDELADVVGHREAGAIAGDALDVDGGGRDAVAVAARTLAERAPFQDLADRLAGVLAEMDDVAAELRTRVDGLEDDPERLETVRARRQLLRDLCRKYGDRLVDVIDFRDEARRRLAELEGHDERLAGLEAELERAEAEVRRAEDVVGEARRRAATELAEAVTARLRHLAMPHADVEVHVPEPAVDRPGDGVEFRLAANPGAPPAPLAKVASGGELSRAMLAIRLALLEREDRTDRPMTLVFDEVDAGLGGTAAVAVAEALSDLAGRHQVIVVTHLPQVAAAADAHLVVRKTVERGVTSVSVEPLEGDDREVEIARMLSGAVTGTGREHARELLSRSARADRSAG